LDIAQPLPQLLSIVIETAHSRFPVFEDDRDNIIGILLAKDLLRCMLDPGIELRSLVRPAVFIPESKRLNILLRDFRESRNHLAIVIDEHGGIAGLISMEDVLEEIVGDIEDEFDEDDEATIFAEGENQWRVQATTDIDKFNENFGLSLSDDEYDTIGGWLGGELGRIPRRGDFAEREGLRFEVVRADPRRALWLRVKRLPSAASPTSDSDHA
jgi:magnesium and cobalt transporter